MKRGHPGGSNVRKGSSVGPDYPHENWVNPVNNGIEEYYEPNTEDKTLESPNKNTLTLAGQPLRKGTYDRLWEGK